MARYKHTDAESGQGMFLAVNLNEQLLPGTFEYMLNDLIGGKIDVSIFDTNYKNDKTGAKAIAPAVLIKLAIYGYSKGINSSRGIEALAKHNIIAKALTCDTEPHWTTIADFISGNSEKFKEVFVKALAYCVELGLIGGQTFAIDGCRLPSNASMEMSGTQAELEKKLGRYRRMAEKHVAKHRRQDERGAVDQARAGHYLKRQKHLQRQLAKISGFLENMEKKEGKQVEEVKSNVTDNESAMIRSSSGYMQGYIGIAVSDKQNQIIINAEAVGSATEGGQLPWILDSTLETMEAAAVKPPDGGKLTVLMDNDYYSEENFRACLERGVEAIIPDGEYGKRLAGKAEGRYEAEDFKHHEEGNYYECPNGKKLGYRKTAVFNGRELDEYRASSKDCNVCPLQRRCMKAKKAAGAKRMRRSLMVSKSNTALTLCAGMRKKLEREEYQDTYAYRIQIVEPVFANITYCKGLDRFTLRGKDKVNGQWKLYCIVHNLGKCLKAYNDRKKKSA